MSCSAGDENLKWQPLSQMRALWHRSFNTSRNIYPAIKQLKNAHKHIYLRENITKAENEWDYPMCRHSTVAKQTLTLLPCSSDTYHYCDWYMFRQHCRNGILVVLQILEGLTKANMNILMFASRKWNKWLEFHYRNLDAAELAMVWLWWLYDSCQ